MKRLVTQTEYARAAGAQAKRMALLASPCPKHGIAHLRNFEIGETDRWQPIPWFDYFVATPTVIAIMECPGGCLLREEEKFWAVAESREKQIEAARRHKDQLEAHARQASRAVRAA